MRATFALLMAWLTATPPLIAQDWPPPEERFLDWTDLQFSQDEYRARRRRMVDALQGRGGGVLLVPSADGVTHGTTFRQADGFNYFVGLELPGSMLVLDADARESVLFLPRRDPRFENPDRRNDFPGRPLGEDPAVVMRAGVDRAEPFRELAGALDAWARQGVTVWIDGGSTDHLATSGLPMVGGLSPERTLALALAQDHPDLPLRNAHVEIARLRMVKSEAEIAAMRRAAHATTVAIRQAAAFVAPGVDERTLEGRFELACKRTGSQRPAFASIIKSGPNSLWPWRVLASHYDRRNRSMATGELVIFDVGCEMGHYSSDVGRTFPVGGRFSARQRELLEMVTAVADAIIAGIRPGVTLLELRELAERATPDAERRHMQTGSYFGHHVGLAVGDPALADAPLEAGMVFTVEPWYYNHEEGIAVFVEDEVLVTAQGADVLTGHLPRDPTGLEELVGRAR